MAVGARSVKHKRITPSSAIISVTASEQELITASISLNTIALHLTCNEIGLDHINRIKMLTLVIAMLGAEENFSSKGFKVTDIEKYSQRENHGNLYKFIQSLVDAGFITCRKKLNNNIQFGGFLYVYHFTNKAVESHLVFGRNLFALMAKDKRFKDRL